MTFYEQGELVIESEIPIMNITEFDLTIRLGRHSAVCLSGEIAEKDGKTALLQGLDRTGLNIKIKNEAVFNGIVQDAEIVHEGAGYRVLLHGISSTALIDARKKSRTFQDTNKTYKEIMREALSDTDGAKLKFNTEDKKIDFPVYQIEETDWEFVSRLSSHLNVKVVPDERSSSPCVVIGLPEGKIQNTEIAGAVCEKVWMDRNGRSIRRSIRGYANWSIGDQIRWDENLYFIIEKGCRLEQGLFCYRYTIAGRNAVRAKRCDNPQHIGFMLPAVVLDRREEEVKVKFDIDKVQSRESAYWYPWRPDAGNMMYCMPEIGEPVYLCLSDSSAEKARAVCGVHRNGRGNPEMKATDRYFTTAARKRMYLTPDTLGFKDLRQSSPLEIVLNDCSGASVRSNRKLVISAKDRIGVKAKNIVFQAPKEISMVRRDNASPTVINMCNGFDSVGATNEVTASGSGEANFPVFAESNQKAGKEYSLGGAEKRIIASTPGKGLTGRLEQQIQGIKVDKAAGESVEGLSGSFGKGGWR